MLLWYGFGSGIGAAAAVVREGFRRQGQARDHQVDAPDGADGQPSGQGLQYDEVAGQDVQDTGGQHPPGPLRRMSLCGSIKPESDPVVGRRGQSNKSEGIAMKTKEQLGGIYSASITAYDDAGGS